MKKLAGIVSILIIFLINSSFTHDPVLKTQNESNPSDTIHFPEEKHFANVRQLTFGGDNAEAYFSFDGEYLIFQKTNIKEGIQCDQIWMGKIPHTAEEKL